MPELALTRREDDVLALLVRGLSVKQIAQTLDISPWTVTTHTQAIYAKADVRTRAELMSVLLEQAYAVLAAMCFAVSM